MQTNKVDVYSHGLFSEEIDLEFLGRLLHNDSLATGSPVGLRFHFVYQAKKLGIFF